VRARRWLRRGAIGLGALVALVALLLAVVAVDGWRAFGGRAEGARRERMERSGQWRDGRFHNPQPLWNDTWGVLTGLLGASADGSPKAALPVEKTTSERFATPPASGLRVTWLGHSSLIVEIDGHVILTDPVWGERSSPLTWAGPRRWYDPPIPLEELPPLDAVVLSHDHYDHLDHPTIVAMVKLAASKNWQTPFIAPLGVGAHLAKWGVPEARIVELDWWERTRVRDLTIACTPARHASGRAIIDTDATLWAGHALLGPRHRVYFSGDTGLFPALREIGERLGPFDLTMIEAGAYNRAWPDWHLGPEQAVTAHQMVRGRVLLPIHWGLFNLAFHGWTEPIERVLAAARPVGVPVLTPRPGESLEPEATSTVARWWPDVPWQSAEQHPVISTKMTGAVTP
jgi:L-ascorbate metabolism protein UlaG (beta-lactamase superfamily)